MPLFYAQAKFVNRKSTTQRLASFFIFDSSFNLIFELTIDDKLIWNVRCHLSSIYVVESELSLRTYGIPSTVFGKYMIDADKVIVVSIFANVQCKLSHENFLCFDWILAIIFWIDQLFLSSNKHEGEDELFE